MSYKRVDQNQKAIVKALRSVGVFVSDTHAVGHGHPDILTYSARFGWIPMEVKSDGAELTPDEHDWWIASGTTPIIVRTIREALAYHGIAI